MDRLDDLLLEWDDRRRRGEPVGADDLCPDDPALRKKLAETITLIEAFESMMPAQTPPAPRIPERIGKYEIRHVLGIGGMGVVYAAWDPVLARTVAIKVIQPRRDPAAARRAANRFLREGQLLARFGRKSIVSALEAGEQGGAPYLVMDYLPGGSLAARQEQLTEAGPRVIVPLMEKVARAVQDAHDQGVLHRDLKPGNVLLDEKGNPFVADFGLAELLATDAPRATGSGNADEQAMTDTLSGGGTPPYMAPEQWDPIFGPVGKPADVWALGVMLYELLAGRKPFVLTEESTYYELITRYVPPPPPGASKALAAVLARCLEKQPEARFQSAGELADALRALCGPTRRTMLRRTALAGVGLLAAGVPTAYWASDPYRRFRWATQGQLDALNHGRTIDLIEPGGAVPNYYLRSGVGNTQIGMGADGFVIRSSTFAMVELLPGLPEAGCQVELEIQHTISEYVSGAHGSIGLFYGAARVEYEGLIHHFLAYSNFDEFDQRPVISLAAIWYKEPPPGTERIAPPLGTFLSRDCSRFYPAVIGTPKPFRTLRYQFHRDHTLLTWEGPPQKDLGPHRHAELASNIDSIESKSPGLGRLLGNQFAPRLGVFVSGGSITVRKLRITPVIV